MTTGEIIKDLLEKKGKTQAQLSRYLSKCTGEKVSANTVNRWIPNEKNTNKRVYPPSNKFLPIIAEFFNVSIDILLGEVGEWDSKYHQMFSTNSFKHTDKYCDWLESLGYEFEDTTPRKNEEDNIIIDGASEITISWSDGNGFKEERTLKAVDFDMMMKHMEKYQKLFLEDYYERW